MYTDYLANYCTKALNVNQHAQIISVKLILLQTS